MSWEGFWNMVGTLFEIPTITQLQENNGKTEQNQSQRGFLQIYQKGLLSWNPSNFESKRFKPRINSRFLNLRIQCFMLLRCHFRFYLRWFHQLRCHRSDLRWDLLWICCLKLIFGIPGGNRKWSTTEIQMACCCWSEQKRTFSFPTTDLWLKKISSRIV